MEFSPSTKIIKLIMIYKRLLKKRQESQKELVQDFCLLDFVKELIILNKLKIECTLIITEGDSAMCMFTAMCKEFPHFRDNFGMFPLRGKIKNVNCISDD